MAGRPKATSKIEKPVEDPFLWISKAFEDIIEKSYITSEVTVQGQVFKLRTIDTSEMLNSESAFMPGMAPDTMGKVRFINYISYALVEINGVPIYNDDMEEDVLRATRDKVYKQLMMLPPPSLDAIIDGYLELVNKQNELLKPEVFGEALENFSEVAGEK